MIWNFVESFVRLLSTARTTSGRKIQSSKDPANGCSPAMAIARRPAHFLLVDQAPEADVENGQLRIPDRPGLGINLVPDRVGPFLWTEVGL